MLRQNTQSKGADAFLNKYRHRWKCWSEGRKTENSGIYESDLCYRPFFSLSYTFIRPLRRVHCWTATHVNEDVCARREIPKRWKENYEWSKGLHFHTWPCRCIRTAKCASTNAEKENRQILMVCCDHNSHQNTAMADKPELGRQIEGNQVHFSHSLMFCAAYI